MTRERHAETAYEYIGRGRCAMPPMKAAGAVASLGTTLVAAAQYGVIDGPAGRPKRQRSIEKPMAPGILYQSTSIVFQGEG